MKFSKYIAIAISGLALVGCSDKDNVNTASGVTVEMAKASIEVKENTGLFHIPVVVTGEPNAPVKVEVKVETVGVNPAVPFENQNGTWAGNYIVTSKTINIPADEKTASIEINTVDDKDENDDRTFQITIVAADGAQIGTTSTCVVTIKDNDKVPYEKVQGSWTLSFIDVNGNPANTPVSIEGYEESDKNYGNLLSLCGIALEYADQDMTYLDMDFYYNEATGESYVEFQLPEPIATYQNAYYIWVLNGLSLAPATVRADFSADLQTLEFDPEAAFVPYVASPDFSVPVGYTDVMSSMKMTRN